MVKKLIFIYFLLFVKSLSIFGQGFSSMEFYAPDDYIINGSANTQNWEALQDTNGYIYFGNGDGVLIYNGVDWNLVHIGETGRGLSFFQDKEYNFYASGQYNFGTLEIDSLNRIEYRSLSDSIFEYGERVNIHYSTLQISDEIYFYGVNGVDILKDETIMEYPISDISFPIAFKLNEELYISTDNGLLKKEENNKFRILPSSEVFESDTLMFAVSISQDSVLLGYLRNGLFYFDGLDFTLYNSELNSISRASFIYDAVKLKTSRYVVGTLYNGIFFIDKHGKIEKHFTEEIGLASNGVLDLYTDSEENLWLGLWGGIQKINLNTPINYFDEKLGIQNEVTDLILGDEEIWLESLSETYKGKKSNKSNDFIFEKNNFLGQIFFWENEFYGINKEGLFKYDGNGNFEKIISEDFVGYVKNYDSDELTILSHNSIVKYDGNNWLSEKLNLELLSQTEGVLLDGSLFLSLGTSIYRIKDKVEERIEIQLDKGKPFLVNQLGVIDSKIYAAIEGGKNAGLFVFDEKIEAFKKDSILGAIDLELVSEQVLSFVQCHGGDIWIDNNKKIKRLKIVENNYVSKLSPYQLIGDEKAIYDIECDGEGGVWFGGAAGLYHLTDPDWEYRTDFKTNITGIYVNNDSLIYGGFGEPMNPIVLPYEDNELRFTYAATSYIDETRNTYSVMLEGFDNNWSDWSLETQKDYTNIPEGDYIFRVRSKNVYEVDGREDRIMFSVLPPWYRTWWAYVLYFISFSGVLYSAYRVRVNQLLKVERMRTKIASDLHDEVSATLTGISYFAEAVKTHENNGKKEHFIKLISESAGDAKEKISDIVWAITPENDNWQGFLSRCRRYASDLLESSGLEYELKIAESMPGKLNMQTRQHLWMIFKEMLTNVVRHSDASRVDVILDVEEGVLKLIIQDDGKGIEHSGNTYGNGLTNIRNRADAIKARIELDSEKDMGTRWRLELDV